VKCVVFIDGYILYYNHRQHETNTHRPTRMSVIMSLTILANFCWFEAMFSRYSLLDLVLPNIKLRQNKFEDINGVIRNRKSKKNRQHNGHK
jgi:hypothetical protein